MRASSRLAVLLWAFVIGAGCDCGGCDCGGCDCGGCDCSGTFTRVNQELEPELDDVAAVGAAYLRGRPETTRILGPIVSIERDQLLILSGMVSGTVNGEDARRIRFRVEGRSASGIAEVVVVRRGAAWVAIGATLDSGGTTSTVGEPVRFVVPSSGGDWD